MWDAAKFEGILRRRLQDVDGQLYREGLRVVTAGAGRRQLFEIRCQVREREGLVVSLQEGRSDGAHVPQPVSN